MNRENTLVAVLVAVAAVVIAYQVVRLVELYFADCPPGPPEQDDGPAAWEVSALMEEARRITGEAS